MSDYRSDVFYIQQKANEVLRLLLKDGVMYDTAQLKCATEQLARAIYDLTVISAIEKVDAETTLQATKAKMHIVCNLLEKAKAAHS
ncbi:hypothetical protein [Anoxybacteroides tepidamans]|uniref:hypothetical protein n=1 Tax=Anoxybacteroides tepidamans TaxID=265948 RepID=UPI000487A093|nr:hypothetical protein [Anoxybacillus tepidamans]